MGKTVVVLPTLSKYVAKVQAKRQESMCKDIVVMSQTDLSSEHLGGPLYTSAPEGFFEGYVSSVDKSKGIGWIASTQRRHHNPVSFSKSEYQNRFDSLIVTQPVVYVLDSTPEGLRATKVALLEKIQ